MRSVFVPYNRRPRCESAIKSWRILNEPKFYTSRHKSSGGFSRSWASIKSEIAKCVLVCANCHREIEIGLVKVNSKHLQSVEEPLE
jgi:formate-dependent nitrite reductase cytochrome c552 subunit